MKHLSKILLMTTVLLLALMFQGCAKGPVNGTYEGDVFYVTIKYTFKGSSFTAETITGNGIQVGGGKGTYTLEEGKLTFNYIRKYVYDNDTNTGSWHDDDKELYADYLSDQDIVKLSTDSGLVVELKKE